MFPRRGICRTFGSLSFDVQLLSLQRKEAPKAVAYLAAWPVRHIVKSKSFNPARGCNHIILYRILLDFKFLGTLISSLCLCPLPGISQPSTHLLGRPTFLCLPSHPIAVRVFMSFSDLLKLPMSSRYPGGWPPCCALFCESASSVMGWNPAGWLSLHRSNSYSATTLWDLSVISSLLYMRKKEFMEIQCAHYDTLGQLPLWTVQQKQLQFKCARPLTLHGRK